MDRLLSGRTLANRGHIKVLFYENHKKLAKHKMHFITTSSYNRLKMSSSHCYIAFISLTYWVEDTVFGIETGLSDLPSFF